MPMWNSGVMLAPSGGVLSWILIGLLAGAIASHLVRGRGYGCLLDIVVGVLGAFLGGLLVSFVVPHGTSYGFVGSLLVAILGSIVLLAAVRLISSRKR
jgi:uncharacterized membrane protein YeaQ/YmgE (transglycosylase-associated protein family)